MCGLFGVMAPLDYPHDRRLALSTCVRFLGSLAEERGIDAAGLATLQTLTAAAPQSPTGGWTIRRTSRRFSALSHSALTRDVRRAQVVLGHTRWATQGRCDVANASPLLTGTVLGTHNGDIDTASLVPFTVREAGTGTDSAVLFAALSDAHEVGGTERDLVPVLAKSVGRTAAVWADITEPGRIWLTRAALSPLAVARDAYGAIWWASNPAWLRRMAQHLGAELGAITMLTEGTLLVADVAEHRCDLRLLAEYTPHARISDVRIASHAAWRGFTPTDRARDKARLRHRIVHEWSQNSTAAHLAPHSTRDMVNTVDGALI